MAKKILIKTSPTYRNTGESIKNYLKSINIIVDLISDGVEYSHKKHLYDKIYEVDDISCVDIILFGNLCLNRNLDVFYWGNFSIDKMLYLHQNIKEVHIYNSERWPIAFSRNFIGISNKTDDLNHLANSYKRFEWIDGDDEWVYQTLVYCGCEPVNKKNIQVVTSKELVKKLGITDE